MVGHSFGGLLAQILAGRGRAAVSGRDQPRAVPGRAARADFHGAVRAAGPTQSGKSPRAVSLTYEQFRYSVANATDEREAAELFTRYAVPAGGRALFQDALANINPWTEARVDSRIRRGVRC